MVGFSKVSLPFSPTKKRGGRGGGKPISSRHPSKIQENPLDYLPTTSLAYSQKQSVKVKLKGN
jgi:hypothetical protein